MRSLWVLYIEKSRCWQSNTWVRERFWATLCLKCNLFSRTTHGLNRLISMSVVDCCKGNKMQKKQTTNETLWNCNKMQKRHNAYVTNWIVHIVCYICTVHLHVVLFAFCLICILLYLHFVSLYFANLGFFLIWFCCICILL